VLAHGVLCTYMYCMPRVQDAQKRRFRDKPDPIF